jgi:hypothetical protein
MGQGVTEDHPLREPVNLHRSIYHPNGEGLVWPDLGDAVRYVHPCGIITEPCLQESQPGSSALNRDYTLRAGRQNKHLGHPDLGRRCGNYFGGVGCLAQTGGPKS